MMPRLLTVDDVCAQLSMGRDWVYGEVRGGRFPAVRCGRFYRFAQEDVDAWITANTVGTFPASDTRLASAR